MPPYAPSAAGSSARPRQPKNNYGRAQKKSSDCPKDAVMVRRCAPSFGYKAERAVVLPNLSAPRKAFAYDGSRHAAEAHAAAATCSRPGSYPQRARRAY